MTTPAVMQHLTDDRLDDLADGLLDAATVHAANAHLTSCAECTGRFAELRELLARSASARQPVEPPAHLWPLVVASTIEFPNVRRRVLRSFNRPLAVAALALVVLSSALTAWVVRQTSAHGDRNAVAITAILEEDADYEAALGGRSHESDFATRERIRALRQRLAGADAAGRNAPDDEALYRTLADRERIVGEVRTLLGRPPKAPRAPIAPAPGRP